jgi:serine/threonine protein kinase
VLRDLVHYAGTPPLYMWISAFRGTPLENVPYPAIWAGQYGNERVVLKEVTMKQAAGKVRCLIAWSTRFLTLNWQVFWREAIAWRQFHHPNILPFRGIAQHPDRLDGYYLVSPYLQNMTLSSYINNPHGGYHAATQRRVLVCSSLYTSDYD